jgi:hypothetical protein
VRGGAAPELFAQAWLSGQYSCMLYSRIVLTLIELHSDSHQNSCWLHSCEAADFVIDCAAKLPAQLIITGGGWQSRRGRARQRRPKPPSGGRLATCQDMPSHAPRMSCYTGATSTTNATTTLRADQRAGGGEGLVT